MRRVIKDALTDMSFMYSRKRRVPRTEPWRTPDVIWADHEVWPSTRTSIMVSVAEEALDPIQQFIADPIVVWLDLAFKYARYDC